VNYNLDVEKIQKLVKLRQDEQTEMVEYMKTKKCLMMYLGQALDDPKAIECGKCANCVGKPLLPTTFSFEFVNQAAIFLKRDYQTIRPRKQWPAGNMFKYYPFFKGIQIELVLRAEEGRALSLWGDAGWGEMVRDGKYQNGKFADELVDGCMQMLKVWNPEPAPTWVTCIPSLKHAELVPDFAQRLANCMGLPFSPCLKKKLQNQEQKFMQNSYKQAKNLDGVFEVDTDNMGEGPVLLLDDMVDSRWTFTIAAALLRYGGCPRVLPLALSLNSPRKD
jgi:ATP-dependent DNA helicase RecQ